METNVNYTAVGAFVIVLLSAIILAIIWLSSGLTFNNRSYYIVYMTESVAGLNIDSPVEFNGVNVGAVKKITINQANPKLVELLLAIHKNTPVTRGTVATINARGFTGLSYVALKDQSKDVRPLVIRPGEKYAVIPSAPSIFVRIDSALSILTENFHDVAESIRKLLNDENQESIKQILNNLQSITAQISANNARLNSILVNTERATAQFGPFMHSGTRAMRAFEAQTLPAANQLINNLDDVTDTLSDVANEIKQNPSVLIRGTEPHALGPGERR